MSFCDEFNPIGFVWAYYPPPDARKTKKKKTQN